jgi:sugar phosphate isomerase/epimerase
MTNEYFYPGAQYPLDSGYTSLATGYNVTPSNIGLTTDSRTANQIQEVGKKLNLGTRVIEISMGRPDIFESIPQQHLTEINRLSKLTGAELTLHAPLVDPAGFDENMRWSEANREMAERQMSLAVSRAQLLNPDKGINVTFHPSAGVPEGLVEMREKEGIMPKSMTVIDPQTGELKQLKEQKRYFPGEPSEFNPEKELEKINKDQWLGTLQEVSFYANRGRDIYESAAGGLEIGEGTGRKENREKHKKALLEIWAQREKEKLTPAQIEKMGFEKGEIEKGVIENSSRHYEQAQVSLMTSYNHLKTLYDHVYKEAKDEDKEKLDAYKDEIAPLIKQEVYKNPLKLPEFAKMIEQGIHVLKDINPQIYQPLDNFLLDKTAKSFANVAWQGFNEAKKDVNKTPVISIENPPVGTAFGRAEELVNLITKSKEEFAKKAVESGMSQSEAEKTAEKIIGATWDVGHINMLRKYGYDSVDIIKETEKIAKLVKHVHLSDNFGLSHTELPMGMGNVPIKQMLEKLQEAGVAPKKIIEAYNWYEHFKTIPFAQTLEAMGSPLYAMKTQPYWSKPIGYFTGYGTFLPEEHISMYGGGFSTLPTELGGQVPQRGSRFSGTPME